MFKVINFIMFILKQPFAKKNDNNIFVKNTIEISNRLLSRKI